MKILLTGANGFLGNYIKEYFQQHHTLLTLGRSFGSTYICDLSTEVPVLDTEFDVVIHAAGKAHVVPRDQNECDDFFRVNYHGTINLLKSLEDQHLLSFIFISSVAVYGLLEGDNITEISPLNATDPYGKSKIMAEAVVKEWCNMRNVPYVILRLPILIGPKAPGNLKAMIRGIQTGTYFNISGGKAKKSMVLAADIPHAIQAAIGKTGTFNLSDGYHPSFKELSSLIACQTNCKVYSIPFWIAAIFAKFGDLFGSKAPLNTQKLRKITKHLTFNDTYAQQKLKWSPGKVLEKFKI